MLGRHRQYPLWGYTDLALQNNEIMSNGRSTLLTLLASISLLGCATVADHNPFSSNAPIMQWKKMGAERLSDKQALAAYYHYLVATNDNDQARRFLLKSDPASAARLRQDRISGTDSGWDQVDVIELLRQQGFDGTSPYFFYIGGLVTRGTPPRYNEAAGALQIIGQLDTKSEPNTWSRLQYQAAGKRPPAGWPATFTFDLRSRVAIAVPATPDEAAKVRARYQNQKWGRQYGILFKVTDCQIPRGTVRCQTEIADKAVWNRLENIKNGNRAADPSEARITVTRF